MTPAYLAMAALASSMADRTRGYAIVLLQESTRQSVESTYN